MMTIVITIYIVIVITIYIVIVVTIVIIIVITITIAIIITRPKPAYGLQGLAGGIVGPECSSSEYILGCSQCLASASGAQAGYCKLKR